MAERKRHFHLVVAVMNIGTYSTEFGFSFISEPLEVLKFTEPFPTCILLNKEKKFMSFGNEAEDQHATLCNDEKETGGYFFRGFKLELFNSFIDGKLTIKDVNGKSMSSVDVLSACIEYFRVKIMQLKLLVNSRENDYRFVLTVPEVLKKPCKPFMVEAARNAGIQEDNFFIISEPEAACICCHHLHKNVLKFEGLGIPLQTKTDILVVDTGSEIIPNQNMHFVVDITVKVIRKDSNPEELSQNKSWKFGSDPVDKVYRAFLSDVYGSDVLDEFKDKHGEEYTDLLHEFYVKCQTFRENEKEYVSLRMPIELIMLFEKKRGVSFENFIMSKSSLTFISVYRLLRVLGAAGTSLMKMTFENIIGSLKHALKISHMTDVPTIIMFGQLAESILMQTLIMESFPDKCIIFPENPARAVIKGALLFGHDASTPNMELKSDSSKSKPKLFSER